MSNFNIETTQNVNIEFRLADVSDRIMSYLLDLFIIISYCIVMLLMLIPFYDGYHWTVLLFFTPAVFYDLLCELFLNGQSFGKMILKLRVVKTDGTELSFGACLLRWIFRIIDIGLTNGLVAAVMIMVNNKGQRVGDIAAKTTVLKLNPQQGINKTAYMEVEEGYKPMYPEVERLSERDMQAIKEVLTIIRKPSSYSYNFV